MRYIFRTNFPLKTWDGASAASLSDANLIYLLRHPDKIREGDGDWEDLRPVSESPLWEDMLQEATRRNLRWDYSIKDLVDKKEICVTMD
jgi:hypothetical protein